MKSEKSSLHKSAFIGKYIIPIINGSIDLENPDGDTALMSFIKNEQYEEASDLIEYAKNNSLRYNIDYGNLKESSHHRDKATMLHIACASGNIKMIKFLLANGSNIFASAKKGFTPFHFAASRGFISVIPIFEEYFTKKYPNQNILSLFNICTKMNGKKTPMTTPIKLAIENHRFTFAKILLKKSVNINEVHEANKESLLHQLILINNYEISNFMLRNGADPYIENIDGNNSIDYSFNFGCFESLRALHDNKYDISTRKYNNVHMRSALFFIKNNLDLSNLEEINSLERSRLIDSKEGMALIDNYIEEVLDNDINNTEYKAYFFSYKKFKELQIYINIHELEYASSEYSFMLLFRDIFIYGINDISRSQKILLNNSKDSDVIDFIKENNLTIKNNLNETRKFTF